jgi:lipopolysaccharide export system permease protein
VKTLHTYLARQISASLIMTVAVFTFVLLLGNVLKEVLPLLIGGKVSITTFGSALGLLVPFVWVFSLPMGMLTATLLIFGRFSADQELTAMRASGVSLVSLVTPIILLSLALCGISAWINMDLGPRSRLAFKDLLFNLRVELSSAQLPEARFIRDFPGYIFYVGKNRGGNLQDVLVFMLRHETNVVQTWRAPRGTLQVDAPNQKILLSLFDGRVVTLGEDRPAGIMSFDELPLELDMSQQKSRKAKLSEMSFRQLGQELERIEKGLTLAVPLTGMDAEELNDVREEFQKQKEDLATPIRFQMHRQVAFSFACFGFALVGIPLGIRVHRRETNVGIAIALILVAVYYSMILLASAVDDKPEWVPHILVWIPNFLFQIAGSVMLWKANKGG